MIMLHKRKTPSDTNVLDLPEITLANSQSQPENENRFKSKSEKSIKNHREFPLIPGGSIGRFSGY
jgi:hypothetical protein